jgi:hypothetical protein
MKYRYIIYYTAPRGDGKFDYEDKKKIRSTEDLKRIEKFYMDNRNEHINIRNHVYVGRVWK